MSFNPVRGGSLTFECLDKLKKLLSNMNLILIVNLLTIYLKDWRDLCCLVSRSKKRIHQKDNNDMKITTLAVIVAILLVIGGFAILSTLASASEGVILLLSVVALIGRVISKIALLLNINTPSQEPQRP